MLARPGNESGVARRPPLMMLKHARRVTPCPLHPREPPLLAHCHHLLRGNTNFAHQHCTRDVPSVKVAPLQNMESLAQAGGSVPALPLLI
jgi:hypothetical protein